MLVMILKASILMPGQFQKYLGNKLNPFETTCLPRQSNVRGLSRTGYIRRSSPTLTAGGAL